MAHIECNKILCKYNHFKVCTYGDMLFMCGKCLSYKSRIDVKCLLSRLRNVNKRNI